MAHKTPTTNPPRIFYSATYKGVLSSLLMQATILRECQNILNLVIDAAQTRGEKEIYAALDMMANNFSNSLDGVETQLVDLQILVEKAKVDEHHKKKGDQ